MPQLPGQIRVKLRYGEAGVLPLHPGDRLEEVQIKKLFDLGPRDAMAREQVIHALLLEVPGQDLAGVLARVWVGPDLHVQDLAAAGREVGAHQQRQAEVAEDRVTVEAG